MTPADAYAQLAAQIEQGDTSADPIVRAIAAAPDDDLRVMMFGQFGEVEHMCLVNDAGQIVADTATPPGRIDPASSDYIGQLGPNRFAPETRLPFVSELHIDELPMPITTRESTRRPSRPAAAPTRYPSGGAGARARRMTAEAVGKVGRERVLTQFADHGNVLATSRKTRPALEAGVYRINETMQGIMFEKVALNSDELLRFDDERLDAIRNECDHFWTLAEAFHAMGITHKRGVLLYGAPGCGKTSLLHQVMERAVAEDVVVFVGQRSMSTTVQGLQEFKEVEPERRALVVMEDMDEVCNYNEHAVLEMMDGGDSLDGVLVLGTTNYIERLPPRILRPGRFDVKVEVGPLPKAGRQAYFTHKLTKVETPERIGRIVDATDRFTFAQMRELIASVYCYKRPFEAALEQVRKGGARGLNEAAIQAGIRPAREDVLDEMLAARYEKVAQARQTYRQWTAAVEARHPGATVTRSTVSPYRRVAKQRAAIVGYYDEDSATGRILQAIQPKARAFGVEVLHEGRPAVLQLRFQGTRVSRASMYDGRNSWNVPTTRLASYVSPATLIEARTRVARPIAPPQLRIRP